MFEIEFEIVRLNPVTRLRQLKALSASHSAVDFVGRYFRPKVGEGP